MSECSGVGGIGDGFLPFPAVLCPSEKTLTIKVDKYLMSTADAAIWKQKVDGINSMPWIYFVSCLSL